MNAGHLDEALDVFSRFFVDPLFTEGATGRELKAIYSEHSKNLQNDNWRLYQVQFFASFFAGRRRNWEKRRSLSAPTCVCTVVLPPGQV